jgi:UDP-N-acetylmuramoyl-tripeptide--D-alanyl-D-alanine ligase
MSDMNLSLQQIGRWLPGARVCGDAALLVQRVHTDSRSLQAGDLFVALQGERFDAHDFLPQAAASGAVAALAQHGLDAAQLPGVEVPDSRRALGQLAQAWRAQFALPLIAVTGSNGKTTVTQMIASILRAGWGDNALATLGNLNNDIGVPQTLLRLRAHHRCAVVELGMNHPGEIAGLAAMAQASVALVNNAQREHQEFMASVDAVAQENGASVHCPPTVWLFFRRTTVTRPCGKAWLALALACALPCATRTRVKPPPRWCCTKQCGSTTTGPSRCTPPLAR